MLNLLEAHHFLRLLATGDATVQFAVTNAIDECRLIDVTTTNDECDANKLPDARVAKSATLKRLVMAKAKHLSIPCTVFAMPEENLVFPLLTSLHFQRESSARRTDWREAIRKIAASVAPPGRAIFNLAEITPNRKCIDYLLR